ncbi:MAG: methyltransferase domain-containing protein [Candidatus Brocadiales bacterium]
MDKFLYQLICCPDCNSELSEKKGTLQCQGCGTAFSLEDGIPLLFSQEILQDPLYQAYRRQYNGVSGGLHECYSRDTRYMEIGLLEKLSYHISNYRAAMHTWNSARKLTKHISTSAKFVGPTYGLTVLDLGAGGGMLLSALDGKRVAFDISPFHLKHISTKNILRTSGFAEKLPFKSAVFDMVISIAVFEHVLKPERVAREITRVLKPLGRVMLEVPFNEDPERLFKLEEDASGEPIVEKHTRRDKKRRRPPTLHLRNFKSVEDLTKFFPQLRLTKINYSSYKRKRHFPKWFKALLRPFRWTSDSFKEKFPSLFHPSMLQVELMR